MNIFSPHLSIEQLTDLADGHLPAEAAQKFQGHLTRCNQCTRQLAELRRLIGLMRTDTGLDAPPALIARVVEAFTRQIPAQLPQPFQRVIASLLFDSVQLTPSLGVRAGAAGAARQMLFSAGEVTIDLRIVPAGEAWAVSGQVLGLSASVSQVEMRGATIARSTLNELSEFALPPLPSGDYQFALRLADTEIGIETLTLGKRHDA